MAYLPITYSETSAMFERCVEEKLSSLLMVSSEPGEGVSTLAYALAQRAAASGAKTLYVDFNTHASYCERTLFIPRAPWGLDLQSASEAWVAIEGSSLTVLPAPLGGGFDLAQRNKAKLLDFISALAETFDFVGGDAPCLTRPNRSGLSSGLLASGFEACYLVVASGSTCRSSIETALQKLTEHEARLGGVVMNDRDFPPLREELVRQAHKLSRWVPRLPGWVDRQVRRLPLLTMEF